jgi:hypothetical protein
MFKINWRFVFSKFWQITLTGLLIAIGITLFPQAQCALAQSCNQPKDLWCGSGKCCGPTSGVEWYDRNFSCFPNGSYCAHSQVKRSDVTCSNSNNCNVTDWKSVPSSLRGSIGSQTAINAGRCQWVNNNPSTGRCELVDHWVPVTCCSGSSGSGGGCTPSYAPPTIDDTYTVDPPYPLPWRQEQPPYGEALGMTINDIKAHGGADTACGSGQANITSLTVWVELTEESRDWIVYTLGQRYPGAHVLGEYPQYPERPDDPLHPYAHCAWTYGTSGINTPNAELDCRFFRPWDPGDYSVHVTACQSDGKCTTKVLPNPIKVYLMETRLLYSETEIIP